MRRGAAIIRRTFGKRVRTTVYLAEEGRCVGLLNKTRILLATGLGAARLNGSQTGLCG